MNPFLRPLQKALPLGSAVPGHAYRVRNGRVAVFAGRVDKAFNDKFGASYGTAAILTFPGKDLVGDRVNPTGGNWDHEPRVVNFAHGVLVGFGSRPVLKTITHNGNRIVVPVGVTKWFDSMADLRGLDLNGYSPNRCLSAADQTRAAVESGAMTGVSIEFQPAGPKGVAYHPTGEWSELENRPAYEFNDWNGLGWAHATHPVNPNARTLLMDMPAEQLEKCIKIARDGRLAGRELDPVIKKAFDPYLLLPRSTSVRVEKAVPNDYDDSGMEDPGMDDAGTDAPIDDGDNTPQTAKAAYDAVQQVSDALANLRAVLAKSEHMKARTQLMKHADSIERELEKMQGVGDMVHDEVNGSPDDAAGDAEDMPEDAEAMPEDDAEGEAEEAPAEDMPAEEGDEEDAKEDAKPFGKAIKIRRDWSGRIVTKSGYIPSRGTQFRASDLAAAHIGESTMLSKEIDSVAKALRKVRQQKSQLLRPKMRDR